MAAARRGTRSLRAQMTPPSPVAAESVLRVNTIDATPASLTVIAMRVPDGTVMDQFELAA